MMIGDFYLLGGKEPCPSEKYEIVRQLG